METALFRIEKRRKYSFMEKEAMIRFSFNDNGDLIYDSDALKRMLRKIEMVKTDRLPANKDEKYITYCDRGRDFEKIENFQKAARAYKKALKYEDSEGLRASLQRCLASISTE